MHKEMALSNEKLKIEFTRSEPEKPYNYKCDIEYEILFEDVDGNQYKQNLRYPPHNISGIIEVNK